MNSMYLAIPVALAVLAVTGCASPTTVPPAANIEHSTIRSEVAQTPEWQLGEEWVYRWMLGLSTQTATLRVIDASDGGYIRIWKSTSGEESYRYYTPGLELIAIVRDGSISQQFNPALPLVKFPLTNGMKWLQGAGGIPAGST